MSHPLMKEGSCCTTNVWRGQEDILTYSCFITYTNGRDPKGEREKSFTSIQPHRADEDDESSKGEAKMMDSMADFHQLRGMGYTEQGCIWEF